MPDEREAMEAARKAWMRADPLCWQKSPSDIFEAGYTAAKSTREAAEVERDENFGTIKTMCKALCDLECENGCDEGLEYEGDEWCPCPCIYRHVPELERLREALKEIRHIGGKPYTGMGGESKREIRGRGQAMMDIARAALSPREDA